MQPGTTVTPAKQGGKNEDSATPPPRATHARKERTVDANKNEAIDSAAATEPVNLMDRMLWFQHLHANPHCKWRSFENSETNCSLDNCDRPLRAQDIHNMTEVEAMCNDDKSFLKLGIPQDTRGTKGDQ